MWLKRTNQTWEALKEGAPIFNSEGAAFAYASLPKIPRRQLADQFGIYWADDPAPPPAGGHFTGAWSVAEHNDLFVRLTWETTLPALTALKLDLQARVNAYRDALIDGGYWFQGHRVQSRPTDRENIAAVGSDAALALLAGAQPGNTRWTGTGEPFAWIMGSNEVVPMDAPAARELYTTGALLKQTWTFFARQLKDQIEQVATVEAVKSIDPLAGWPPAGEVPPAEQAAEDALREQLKAAVRAAGGAGSA